ncbi:enoyl-CoA hydratase-related protein, partial [Pseudomonas oryzihabitans]|uniref:enoyl-CoA hydratase-related protein n=2 Tax=Pseudomonas TaxID=286 RepID=UPI00241EC2BE
MTDFHTLELIRDPRGFATLWLDRPDRHNALDAQLIAELGSVLAEIASDQALRFLLLRGRGRHFCAGADLAWMQASARLDAAANRADTERLAEVMYRLQALPMPTLAVVQGAAFGG